MKREVTRIAKFRHLYFNRVRAERLPREISFRRWRCIYSHKILLDESFHQDVSSEKIKEIVFKLYKYLALCIFDTIFQEDRERKRNEIL